MEPSPGAQRDWKVVLMRIQILPPKSLDVHGSETWQSLRDGLAASGHEAEFVSALPADAEAVVDFQARLTRRSAGRWPPAHRCALVILEPSATMPRAHRLSLRARYGSVWLGSPLWRTRDDERVFPWPQDLTITAGSGASNPGPYDAVMIAASKWSASSHSFYSLRREIVSEFGHSDLRLAVVGTGWTDSRARRMRAMALALARQVAAAQRPSARELLAKWEVRPADALGYVACKSAATALAPISIVVENSRDYLSEKLIDAVTRGSAPIYVGPSLDSMGLPAGIALEVRASAKAVLEATRNLTPSVRESVVANGQRWVADHVGQPPDGPATFFALGRHIAASLESDGLSLEAHTEGRPEGDPGRC